MRCDEEAVETVEKADGSPSPSPPPSGLKKGPWTAAEDAILVEYVRKHGEGNWNAVQKNSGLQRCGKSCRLRWANHLRPNLKKGPFTPDEELLILRLHAQLGNKWARMAAQLPGRTDNEIKNYWNTRIKRRTRAGLPLYPPDMHRQAATGHHHLLLHHHHQQLSSSPNTTPPITPTSAPASLTMYDLTAGFPTASRPVPLLSSSPFSSKPVLELPTIKRIRSGAFEFPISGLTTLPLYHHLPPAAAAHYSLGNYDRNPVVQVASLSVKTELPSSQCQLFSISAGCADNGNSGLLDAMLQEAQGIGGDQLKNLGHLPPSPQQDGDGDAREAEWAPLAATSSGNGAHQSPATGLDSVSKPGSSQCPFGMKSSTTERAEEINNVQDLSMMLDMIPSAGMSAAAAVVPDWYTSTDSGEMSNGCQSSMTDDEIGLEMQQLASSLSIAPVDGDWSIGSCSWNNMPGMC